MYRSDESRIKTIIYDILAKENKWNNRNTYFDELTNMDN
jgi:hypothetical protein